MGYGHEITSGNYAKIKCDCCGKIKEGRLYYDGYGKQCRVKVRYCKECCRAKMAEYKEFLGENGALWIILSELGIPFIRKVWEQVVAERSEMKKGSVPELTGHYIKKLINYPTIYSGFWDSDVMLDELLNKRQMQLDRETMDLAEMQRIWGKYPDDEYNEAYDFLNTAFNAYTGGIENMDTNLSARYRDLCKSEYRVRKAYESGDVSEIAKAQANHQQLLKLLKLDNFDGNQKSEAEKFIDRYAWRIENTMPAECEDLEKYKDYANNESMWKDILRTVRNAVSGSRDYPNLSKDEGK